MTPFEAARQAEAADRIEEAARQYEDGLSLNPDDIEARVDLAVLYWQATDYGVSSSRGLPKPFVAAAGKRYLELLQQGLGRFPANPVLRFWSAYTEWTDLGRRFDPSESRKLRATYPDYLEPAMYLYAVSRGTECERDAHELLSRYRNTKTYRARYVVSVIESVAKHARSPR
jgi:hypothetical protein